MSLPNARILVLEPERGIAEAILRGLRAITELRVDVDLVISVSSALEELAARRYDLLVLKDALAERLRGVLDAADDAGAPRAFVAVGGKPDPRAGKNGGTRRVPLPLSFNLLRHAVLEAMSSRLPEAGWAEPQLRDTADG